MKLKTNKTELLIMKKYNIFFNTSEDMRKIPSNTVRLMITSPPYWDLKNYEAENQIGFKEDYQTYLGRINKVWNETNRVLLENGVVVVNINTKSHHKKLKLLPFDIINQFESIGLYLKDIHYWHKSSAIPQLNNFGDHFEYFLIFSKNNPTNYSSDDYFTYKVNTHNKMSNIWNINKKFGSVGKKYMVHPAIFPIEYIVNMIEIFTKKDDIILDPFLGSGTSLIAAMLTKRSFYGFELNNSEYKELIKNRIEDEGLDFNKVSTNH